MKDHGLTIPADMGSVHEVIVHRKLTPPKVPSGVMLSATRSVRRNLARAERQLSAWKNNQNRVQIERSGQQYVPFPLQITE